EPHRQHARAVGVERGGVLDELDAAPLHVLVQPMENFRQEHDGSGFLMLVRMRWPLGLRPGPYPARLRSHLRFVSKNSSVQLVRGTSSWERRQIWKSADWIMVGTSSSSCPSRPPRVYLGPTVPISSQWRNTASR